MIVKDFMRERKVGIGGREWASDVGCPQGSSLGPVLWLLVMEGWFHRLRGARERGVHVQAYADDQVLVISGRSVRGLEQEWTRVWEECKGWALENKLEYSVAKTEAMFVPARGQIREPVVRIDGERVEVSGGLKYLGIFIDSKLSWLEHMKRIRSRTQEVAGKFFALGRRKWGNGKRVLKILYERVVCPMVLYGAEVWGGRAYHSLARRHLRAIERPYLRAITGAYRTSPTAALAVLAGCVPLEVQARALHESRRRWGAVIRRVGPEERPHPALAGYMTDLDAEERTVTVWTDAGMRGRDKAYAWVVSVPGRGLERGGAKLSGDFNTNELEGWAVLKGMREGLFRRGDIKQILVCTDSQAIATQITKQNHANYVVNSIQKEIEEGMREGVRVRVEWRSRRTDGMRVVDRHYKEIVRGEGETEAVEGVGKGWVQRWRREWELEEWQGLWDEGVTGRWTHELKGRVDRKGVECTGELTQVATGHGGFRGYLSRFRLAQGEGRCECGREVEGVEHVVLRCPMPRRVAARDRYREAVGHYPPRFGEVRADQWGEVQRWAMDII